MAANNSAVESSTLVLLALPEEVLRVLYSFVLTEYNTKADSEEDQPELQLKIATPQYSLRGTEPHYVNGDRHMPYYEDLTHSGHLGLTRGTLNLLLVNRQIYDIAVKVFYNTYTVKTTSAESFRVLFTKQIGIGNTRSIRKLTMGLPHCLKTLPTQYLGRYLRLFQQQMPEFRHLKVFTTFGRWFGPRTHQPRDNWVECSRGLLWTAAWVTRGHPLLKFAVWEEEGVVHDNELDQYRADYFDRRFVQMAVVITADRPAFLQNLEDPMAIKTYNDGLIAGEEAKIAHDAKALLLNSWKIRREGWTGLATRDTCRPHRYQLRKNAKTSEALKPFSMTFDEHAEELFFHNKCREITISQNPDVLHLRALLLRATAMERNNDAAELLAKSGPPPPPLPPNDWTEIGAGEEHNGWNAGEEHNGWGANAGHVDNGQPHGDGDDMGDHSVTHEESVPDDTSLDHIDDDQDVASDAGTWETISNDGVGSELSDSLNEYYDAASEVSDVPLPAPYYGADWE